MSNEEVEVVEIHVIGPPGAAGPASGGPGFIHLLEQPGYVGDGVADDTLAVKAAAELAMVSGYPLKFASGTITRITSPITALETRGLGLVGDGIGHSIIHHECVGASIFQHVGTIDDSVDSPTFFSAMPAGSLVIPVTSTAGFSAGQYCNVQDQGTTIAAVYPPGLTVQQGQINRIRTVDSPTQVTLYGSLEFDYTASTIIRGMNLVPYFSARDLSVICNPAIPVGIGSWFAGLFRCNKVRIERCEFVGFEEDVTRLDHCCNFVVQDNFAKDGRNDRSPETTPYFVNVNNGTSHGIVSRNICQQGRHMITSGAGGDNIECAHVIVSDNATYEHSGAAYDQHFGARDWIFDGNLSSAGGMDGENSGFTLGQGLQIRGRRTSIVNHTASGHSIGASIFYHSDNRVIGGTFNGCEVGIGITDAPRCEILGPIKIRNPRLYGVHVSAEKLLRMPGIVVEGNISIEGNPTGAAVQFDHWEDGYRVSGIRTDTAVTKYAGVPHTHVYPGKPDLVKFESMPRSAPGTAAVTPLTSGTMFMVAVELEQGVRISAIGFVAASLAVGQTNLWAALYDQNRFLLGLTADALTAIPAAGAHTKLSLATPYTTTYRGLHYVGIVQAAATVMTLRGYAVSSNLTGLAPIQAGNSTTGLAALASVPLWSPTNLGSTIKAWWDADDHGTARMTDDGAGRISSWTDKIGSMAITAATIARPTWGASVLSSHAALMFDGVANCFASTALGTLPTGATPGTIFIVAANNETAFATNTAIRYGAISTTRDRLIQRVASEFDPVSVYRISNGSDLLDDNSAFDGPHLFSGGWSGTTISGRIDGRDTIPPTNILAASLDTGTTGRLRIGAQNSTDADTFWKGPIRHVIITGALAGLGDQQVLEGWGAWNSGLQSLLLDTHPFKAAAPRATNLATAITPSGQLPYISVG